MTLPSSETSVSDKPAYLSSASQPVQQEIDKEVLNPAAKVVENFDNPVKNDENLSEDDELFRDGDAAEYENFKKRKYQYIAKDIEGRDVFLADSGYVLSMAQQDFKHIKFHFTSEF